MGVKKQLLFQVFEEDLKFIARDHIKKTAMDRGEKAFFIGVDKQNLIFFIYWEMSVDFRNHSISSTINCTSGLMDYRTLRLHRRLEVLP